MNTDMVSCGNLNEAIKLSSTYYDDKTSKLLIMISDGKIIARAHRSCRRNKLGIKIITIGVGTEKEAQSL
jgi:hypothetical protein